MFLLRCIFKWTLVWLLLLTACPSHINKIEKVSRQDICHDASSSEGSETCICHIFKQMFCIIGVSLSMVAHAHGALFSATDWFIPLGENIDVHKDQGYLKSKWINYQLRETELCFRVDTQNCTEYNHMYCLHWRIHTLKIEVHSTWSTEHNGCVVAVQWA